MWVKTGTAVVLLAFVAACGSSGKPAATAPVPAIGGQLVLAPSDNTGLTTTDGANCSGVDGYSDINQGAQVTLTSETGTILASSQLSAGKAGRATTGLTCTFIFSFGQVSAPAKFYSVEIGHRGKITDSAAVLKAAGDKFSVTLGQ